MNNSIISLQSKRSNDVCCCVHCGKGYKTRTNMEKHLILCEIVHKKPRDDDEFENNLPSQKMMYKMILELGQKYNRLEEKMNEVNKWVVKKKKKVDVTEWLNATVKPEYAFDNLIDKIIIGEADIEFMFNNNIYDTLNRVLYYGDRDDESQIIPLFAFIQKPNILYAFGSEGVWSELPRDKLVRFLNLIQMKLSKVLFEWKKNHRAEINSNDSLATIFDKTTSKLMGAEFKKDNTLSRVKNMIYSRLKTDVKTMIEYEFE